MSLEEFIKKALLVPFKEKGRDMSGWDCYGLVFSAYREIYGITLPEYLDYSSTIEYAQLKKLIGEAKAGGPWKEVRDPCPGDIAVFNLSKSPCHIALMIDRMRALHTEAKLGTFIEPLKSPIWIKRLEGIYRYGALCLTK